MRHFTLLLLSILCTCAHAQTIVNCGETFFDPGGADADYPSNADVTYQLCPTSAGDAVTVEFTQVDLEDCCDEITVYNGIGTDAELSEVNAPTSLTSSASDGCLTVVFQSDGSVEEAGFTATVSCGPAPSCPAPVNLGQNTVTTTTAEIFWQEIGSATQFDVFVVPAGTMPAGDPDFDNVSNNFTVTGLEPETLYDIYVRADCDGTSGDDESSLTGPLQIFSASLPPSNDFCSGAIPVTISNFNICENSIIGTTDAATDSGLPGNCSPGGPFDVLYSDVWYSFVPNTTSVQIRAENTVDQGEDGNTNFLFETYASSCNDLLFIACGERPTNLVPGQTYYLRIRASRFVEFNLCVMDQPAPPPNDNCINATALAVSPNVECGAVVSATTWGANESQEANCGGTADDDIWFSFTATAPSQLLTITDITSIPGTNDRDLIYEVFSGNCNSLVSVVCAPISPFSDPPAFIEGLNTGSDYLLRIYTTESSAQVTFDICLSSPPVNDECAGAIDLPVNADAECGSTVSASTVGATRSGDDCGFGATADDDVYFSFTATRTTHLLIFSNLGGPGNSFSRDLQYELSEGGCDNNTVIVCDILTDVFAKELSDLTVGTEYLLRIFTRSSFTRATFDLCLGAPPANDDCDAAIVVPVNPDLTNTVTTAGTTFGATRSFDIDRSETGCSFSANEDDVWYRFTAISSEHRVSILNATVRNFEGGTANDDRAIVRLYAAENGCAAPVELSCGFLDGNADEEFFSGLTPGADYFLSVQSFSFRNYIEYDLSIKTEEVELPIQLISFTGRVAEKFNALDWSVAVEENFSHYELQRSSNGINGWEVLAEIKGAAAGAENGLKSYEFKDVSAPTKAFYRLRSVDLDGSYDVSTLVQLQRAGVEGIRVYPNPNDGRFSLDLPVVDGVIELNIYEASGQLVISTTSTEGLPVLRPGLYQLVATSGNKRWIERIVVR